MEEVIVIGAGAAGLAAARRLAQRGMSVTVLEARARTGGRIFTVKGSAADYPVELGAEFIHGQRNRVWDLVEQGKLQTHEVPDRHWCFAGNLLSENPSYRDHLGNVLRDIGNVVEDRDVLTWLTQKSFLENSLRQMTLDFVEGFHAAPADRMSLKALALSNGTSEQTGGDRAFRIHPGYKELTDLLLEDAVARGARVHLNAAVTKVRWGKGAVEIEANTEAGPRLFHAARAVVTLPLGVLKSGCVNFDPPLTEKEEAIQGLEMGDVVKLVLRFKSRFWPVDNFGYIHSDDKWLPAWWADERAPVLTGWVGGRRATSLTREDDATILGEALRALSGIFGVQRDTLQSLLERSWHHDWHNDPFSRGAYSYTPVGGIQCPQRLGDSLLDTLFFAGEATNAHGEQGTVQAALASGERAADELAASLRRSRCNQVTGMF